MICGACNQPAENHPNEFCPYLLEPVIVDGKTQGYMMERKPQDTDGKAEI